MFRLIKAALFAVYIWTSAGSQITEPIVVSKIRWVGADQAGHEVILTESTIGSTGTQVWKSEAGGASHVEESSALVDQRLRGGIRVERLDSGQVWIYTKDQ